MLIVPMAPLQSSSRVFGSRSIRVRFCEFVTTNSTGAALLVSSVLQLSVATETTAAAMRISRFFMMFIRPPGSTSHDARRDEDEQLIVRRGDIPALEEIPDDRDIVHIRHARLRVTISTLENARDHGRAAIAH